MKDCSKCQKNHAFELFYRDKNTKDGFSYWCRECFKENVRRHRTDPLFRQKQVQWNNKWRFRPENRQKVLNIRLKSQKLIYNQLKLVGFVTKKLRQQVLERDKFMCLCCKNDTQLTVDHIVPISLGGDSSIENLQILCRSCNAKKQKNVTDYRNSS